MKLKQKVIKLSLVAIAVGSTHSVLADDIDRSPMLDAAEVMAAVERY
ncbi:hypothetical protein [Shewanella psychrotolerans]|nr:hypothetical protein [Shewanella psychrotolerans]QYK01282.1 hypothetical protein K0I62_18315 [Shewanella psychrotolerans]